MVKVKAPKVPVTEVTTTTQADVAKLLATCAPYRTMADARDAAIVSQCQLHERNLRLCVIR
jgi:hypothetical protein